MAFDLETTGVDPQSDEIIEIAAVRVRGGQVVGEFSELCDPGRPIPLKIRRLTGISPEMLDGKPAAAQVLPAFLSFAGGGPLVAHNSDFDRSFLVNQLARIGRTMTCQVYDSLELARILLPLARNHRLGSLAAELGLPLEQGHRALDDARAAAALMVRLWAAAAALDHGLLSQIVGLAGDEPWPLKDVFSSALAKAATRFQDRRISREFASAEEAEELPDRSPVDFDPDQLKGVVGAKGPLAARLGTYEDRPGQAAMLELVARALEEGRHAVVEAGTGTGKSIAYLIPSLYWSLAKGERVVVSTHTINLQEQLWEKDLPLLAGCLDLPFRAALVKGRSNYLCLRRFKESVDQADFLSSSERRLLVRVLTWVKQTTTGDRSELNLFGEGEEAWVTVCSESESCLGVKCPWQSRHCFFYRARRRAERADLIVANHALVFADVQSGNQILPPYSHLILDEAHHIEDVATEHLGTSVSHGDVRRTLTLLFRGYNEQGNPGFLANLRRHYGSRAGTSGAGTSRPETAGSGASGSRGPLALVEDLIGLTQSARQGVDELFMALSAFVRDSAPGDDDGTAATLRLKEEHRDSPAWKEVDAARANATGRLRELSRGLARLGEVLERGEEDLAGTEFAGAGYPGAGERQRAAHLKDLEKYSTLAYEQASAIDFVLCAQGEGSVDWVEISRPGEFSRGTLRSAPIHVGPTLAEKLFGPLRTAVMTSATITVNGNFNHFQERLGLDLLEGPRVLFGAVQSPFRYREQALLCVPQDLPSPKKGEVEFYSAVEKALLDLLTATQGRTLVLFTSHKMLRDIYFRLKGPLEEQDICLLAQGLDGGRTRLVEQFKAEPRSVLFGASSFWEGVDIPGEGLSCVVMVKLPFRPPTLPVVEARMEDLERRGLHPFGHLSLPEAIIRFKQGFGRLVRSQRDRGVVVVFDSRVDSVGYGLKFLKSLPGPSFYKAPMKDIADRVLSWIADP